MAYKEKTMLKRIMFISPHADDETLGCGGAILKYARQGYELYWMIVTSPFSPKYRASFLKKRQKQMAQIKRFYGFKNTYCLGLPTTKLGDIPMADIIAEVSDAISDAEPDVIYVANGSDAHSDHRVVFNCVMAVTKPMKKNNTVKKIYAYETLSETDQSPAASFSAFVPNSYVDITEFIEKKTKAMEIYNTETQPYPLPREKSAIRALARYRGSTIGREYAEAFMLIREIE